MCRQAIKCIIAGVVGLFSVAANGHWSTDGLDIRFLYQELLDLRRALAQYNMRNRVLCCHIIICETSSTNLGRS